ncbi:uncharacterized protein LOC124881707 isoform X2 [Girardinichthys multiradiatus]|uniref:uncharacterized protein LOC124881707 isoform X2 n=1 Tax=Girardinichthys multiradiatus TaxID=208333 RepID=UPI001FAB8E7C|nr:uncharacterized protein LOC124881707 isoform X2 [Girardinichthys multiradiatus]
MAEFSWITMFFLLMRTFTAAAQQRSDFVVRDGDEVTLPAECFRNMMKTCEKTTWLFIGQRHTAETLFEDGKFHQDARTKSDRLNVTANCSLVIKKVSVEDVGRYTCRQFDASGRQQGSDSNVYLSVVNISEQKNSDETILNCSVLTYGGCSHTVKWLYDNKDAENIKINPLQSVCSVSVSFPTSPHVLTSKRSEVFRCQVKPNRGDMKEFTFRISPLRDKPGTTQPTKVMQTSTTTTTKATTTTTTTAKPTSKMPTAEPGKRTSIKPTTGSGFSNSKDVWKTIAAAVGSVLLVTVVAVAIGWRKTKGNKTWKNKNTWFHFIQEQNLIPAGIQSLGGSNQNMDDPEGGVAYASISYIKKTNSNINVQDKDDEDGTVTYSTVKASSSAAAASDHHSNLYATVNKPKQCVFSL